MIKDGIIQSDNIYGTPFKVHLIPESNKDVRPGTKIDPTSNTIHTTGNESAGAGEEVHTEFVDNNDDVSWTFTVGDEIIIQELPIDEAQYHSGTHEGNHTSISMELCIDKGSDWEKTKLNAAKLCVYLGKEAGIIKNRTHQSWSGKYCPARILDEGWNKFLELIEAVKMEYTELPSPVEELSILVNGKKISGILLENGKSYAPVRELSEGLGAQVGWDPIKRSVSVTLKEI